MSDLRRKMERDRLLREAGLQREQTDPTAKNEPPIHHDGVEDLVSAQTIESAKKATKAAVELGQQGLDIARQSADLAMVKAAGARAAAKAKVAGIGASIRSKLASSTAARASAAVGHAPHSVEPVAPAAPEELGKVEEASCQVGRPPSKKKIMVGAVALGLAAMTGVAWFVIGSGESSEASQPVVPSDQPAVEIAPVVQPFVENPTSDPTTSPMEVEPAPPINETVHETVLVPSVEEEVKETKAPEQKVELVKEAPPPPRAAPASSIKSVSRPAEPLSQRAEVSRTQVKQVQVEQPSKPDWRDKAQQDLDRALGDL